MALPLELELQPAQATFLKNVLEALSDMSSKANFDFSGTGCEVQATDSSGVSLVAFLLRADAFHHYRCYRDLSVGLNIADMAEVFRCANNNDKITIESEGCSFDPVCFTFESENGEISYFYFDAVDIDGMPPLQIQEPSESEFQAIVRLPSAQFMDICKKLSTFGDREDRDTGAIITVDEEGICFFTPGKNGTSKIVCSPKEPTHIEMKEKVSLTFSLSYIKSFSKVSTLSDQVTISLASKKPAVFEYEIAGMGYIRYYLLPMEEREMHEMQNEGRDEMQRIAKKIRRTIKEMRCITDD